MSEKLKSIFPSATQIKKQKMVTNAEKLEGLVGTPTYHSISFSYSIPFHFTAILLPSVYPSTR